MSTTYRRLLRRETHSPRTGAAVAVAVAAILIAAGVCAGGAALAIGSLRTTATTVDDLLDVVDGPAGAAIAAGAVVVALAGLWLIALAVLPGRRARHGRASDRAAIVVDDGALADAVADAVALRSGIPRGRVRASVGRRTAVVRITPTTGVDLPRDAARDAAAEAADAAGFAVRPTVVVAERGVIG